MVDKMLRGTDEVQINELTRFFIPSMDLQLKNKVIIVTGGAKGIGEGIVKVLAKEGALPVIIGRSEADNLKAVQSVEASGGKAFQVVAELTDPAACEKAVAEVLKQFGQIDGLVNNAGVNDGVGLENGTYEGFMASLHKKCGALLLDGASCFARIKKIERSYLKYYF